MRTNFSWLIGSATVTLAAAGSVVAKLWLLGLGPNGTESGLLQDGPDSRPADYRARTEPFPCAARSPSGFAPRMLRSGSSCPTSGARSHPWT